jgi:Domain of unknown function (DUF4383)
MTDPPIAAQRVTYLIACVFGMLGVLGLLRTGLANPWRDQGTDLLGMTTHPITAVIHTALGIVGIPIARSTDASRRYLWLVGGLLAAWTAASFVLDGAPNYLFVRDPFLLAVHAIGAATCLITAALTRRPRGAHSP